MSISTITYLFEKAPFELLQVGAEFELYEGASKVAAGQNNRRNKLNLIKDFVLL